MNIKDRLAIVFISAGIYIVLTDTYLNTAIVTERAGRADVILIITNIIYLVGIALLMSGVTNEQD